MRYLAALALVFLVGCSSVPQSVGGYTDYQAKAADGTLKTHRVYANGSEVWLNQAGVPEAVAE